MKHRGIRLTICFAVALIALSSVSSAFAGNSSSHANKGGNGEENSGQPFKRLPGDERKKGWAKRLFGKNDPANRPSTGAAAAHSASSVVPIAASAVALPVAEPAGDPAVIAEVQAALAAADQALLDDQLAASLAAEVAEQEDRRDHDRIAAGVRAAGAAAAAQVSAAPVAASQAADAHVYHAYPAQAAGAADNPGAAKPADAAADSLCLVCASSCSHEPQPGSDTKQRSRGYCAALDQQDDLFFCADCAAKHLAEALPCPTCQQLHGAEALIRPNQCCVCNSACAPEAVVAARGVKQQDIWYCEEMNAAGVAICSDCALNKRANRDNCPLCNVGHGIVNYH